MLLKSENAHFWKRLRPRHYTLEHRYGVVYCGSTCAFFRDSEEEVSVLEIIAVKEVPKPKLADN